MATTTPREDVAPPPPGPPKCVQMVPYLDGLLVLGEDGSIWKAEIDSAMFHGRTARQPRFLKLYPLAEGEAPGWTPMR